MNRHQRPPAGDLAVGAAAVEGPVQVLARLRIDGGDARNRQDVHSSDPLEDGFQLPSGSCPEGIKFVDLPSPAALQLGRAVKPVGSMDLKLIPALTLLISGYHDPAVNAPEPTWYAGI